MVYDGPIKSGWNGHPRQVERPKMIKLTRKQERALARMAPEAAARRRKTMEAEREIVFTIKHDNAVIAAGLGDEFLLSPFRAALRGAGK